MNARIVSFFSAATLTAMGTFAAAEPVELTDAQMDGITAGQLIEIDRTLNNNNVVVAVPVNANVAANVCIIAQACVITEPSAEQRPGRINVGQ